MSIDARTGPLKKGDLQFVYPTGPTAGDDPTKRGIPDSVFLNRNEWYEVLYVCNKWSQGKLATAQKCERLIKQHLPGNIRSHANVLKWLQDNWSVYN